jgi:hypothetical protein
MNRCRISISFVSLYTAEMFFFSKQLNFFIDLNRFIRAMTEFLTAVLIVNEFRNRFPNKFCLIPLTVKRPTKGIGSDISVI